MTWDQGVEYENVKRELIQKYREYREKAQKCAYPQKRYQIDLIYTAVLLTQLVNGSRVMEALEALIKFYETGEKEVDVRVEKSRKERYRTMVIPGVISEKDLKAVAYYLERLREEFYQMKNAEGAKRQELRRKIASKISHFARKHFGINTHSLRYAFITHMAKKGVSPQIIARITRHTRLDMLITYTQEQIAKDLLREMAKE